MAYKSIATLGLLLTLLGLAAFSYPASAACVFAQGKSLTVEHKALVQEGRSFSSVWQAIN